MKLRVLRCHNSGKQCFHLGFRPKVRVATIDESDLIVINHKVALGVVRKGHPDRGILENVRIQSKKQFMEIFGEPEGMPT